MDPRRRAALFEGAPSLHRLLTAQAGLHADAVVEAVVGAELTLDVGPGARRRAAAGDEDLGRLFEQLLVGNDASDESPCQRLLGVECAPGKEQVASPSGADMPGEDVAVVGVGNAPEQLGGAERRPFA